MKKALLTLLVPLFLAILSQASGATKFVTPSGTGNGTSWSAAGSPASVSQASAGDVYYLAGGSYANGIAVPSSGSAGSPIVIKRATAADHGSDTGWSSSFDTQAVFANGWSVTGKYVTIDGNTWKPPGLPKTFGILVKHGSGTKGIDAGGSPGYLTVRNVEVVGPGFNNSTKEADGIHFPDNSLITGCASHDTDALLFSWNPNSNSTIEYCLLYNASSNIVNSGNSQDPHPDIWYTGSGANNSTVRWCLVANVVSEGFFFDQNSAGDAMLWYGNVMFQGSTQTGAVPIEYQNGAKFGRVFLYHNTLVDWNKSNNLGPGTTLASGSAFKNNLWINAVTNFTPGMDTNGFTEGATGSNAITNAASPFVTSGTYVWTKGSNKPPATQVVTGAPAGYNPSGMETAFVLASNSWAAGKGTSVPAGMNTDMYGNTGNNLGAIQGSGGSGPTPTPAPTATPTATPTPTPAPTATPSPSPAAKFAVNDWVTPGADAIVNVRSTPGGTAVGSHAPPDIGVVLGGPTAADFNGASVQWYRIDWQNGVDGWSGDNDLVKTTPPVPPSPTPSPTPKPTPTPSATPIPSYHTWEAKLNTEMATGVSASQLLSWINANPPTAD